MVELVDLQGQAYKEAADELEIPLGTVMSRLHRARRLMRDRLAGYASSMSVSSRAVLVKLLTTPCRLVTGPSRAAST